MLMSPGARNTLVWMQITSFTFSFQNCPGGSENVQSNKILVANLLIGFPNH